MGRTKINEWDGASGKRRQTSFSKRMWKDKDNYKILIERKKPCVFCKHHKFFKKPKGIFCTRCNKRKK